MASVDVFAVSLCVFEKVVSIGLILVVSFRGFLVANNSIYVFLKDLCAYYSIRNLSIR